MTKTEKQSKVLTLVLAILLPLSGCQTPATTTKSPPEAAASTQVSVADVASLKVPIRLKDKMTRLYHDDPVERAWAAYQLAKLGRSAQAAVPHLAQLLTDHEPVLLSRYLGGGFHSSSATTPGEEAAKALARIGQPAVDSLNQALSSPDPNTRRLAARATGMIGNIHSADTLIQTLSDPDPRVRAAAAIALGSYKHPLVAQKLMDAYQRAPDKQRTHLVYAMTQINDILVVPFLIQQLATPNPDLRAAVVLALGKLRDARALSGLTDALRDQDEIVRANAAYALSGFYTPKVMDILIATLSDEVERVREAAAEALSILSGMQFGTDKSKWESWWQKQKRAIRRGGNKS